MEHLNCQVLQGVIGWRCRPIGDGALYVSTPVLLQGGKPLDFYLELRGQTLVFTDDGLSLFALRSGGFALQDRRHWKGIENLVEARGFQLTSAGAIEGVFPAGELRVYADRILRMFCALAEWQVERIEQEDEDFTLTNEVERLLRKKAPFRPLDRNVSVRLGRSEFTFDFLWGDIYVDALAPVPQAVNARLRKAVVASKESAEDVGLLFVLDDRRHPDKAERELAVLGQVARSIKLSDFARDYAVPV